MNDVLKIAISGKSGSGKTTLARYLSGRYRLDYCSSGKLCRAISTMMLGGESKRELNDICLALRAIDPCIWFLAAIAQVPNSRFIVYDGLRFKEDLTRARSLGFLIVRVSAEVSVRRERLRMRQQAFTLFDERSLTETDLDGSPHDVNLDNNFQELESFLSAAERQLAPWVSDRLMSLKVEQSEATKPSTA